MYPCFSCPEMDYYCFLICHFVLHVLTHCLAFCIPKSVSKFKNFILITHKHLRLECALQLSSVGLNHFEWVIKCLCLIVFLFCFCVCLFSIKNGRISRNNSTICGMCVYFPHAELNWWFIMQCQQSQTSQNWDKSDCIVYFIACEKVNHQSLGKPQLWLKNILEILTMVQEIKMKVTRSKFKTLLPYDVPNEHCWSMSIR